MEPLSRTSIIIACHHLTKADLVAVAVSRLLVFVLVVAFVNGFLIRGDCRLDGRFLGCPLRRGVIASRWSGARLRGLGEVREERGGGLGVATFARGLGLDCICWAIFFAIGACWYGGSTAGFAVQVAGFGNGGFGCDWLARSRSGLDRFGWNNIGSAGKEPNI